AEILAGPVRYRRGSRSGDWALPPGIAPPCRASNYRDRAPSRKTARLRVEGRGDYSPGLQYGPATQPAGASFEFINSMRRWANALRAIGRAPMEARCRVSCWQSIRGTPRRFNSLTSAARQ